MENVKIIDEEYERYKDWDFSNAKSVAETPALKRLQEARANANQQTNQSIDNEVVSWISQQDVVIKQHFNDMLRREMLFIQQQQAMLKTC